MMSNRLADTLIGLGIAFVVTVVIAIPALILPESCLRVMTAFGLIGLCYVLIHRSARQQRNGFR
jgi:hypothetical protein